MRPRLIFTYLWLIAPVLAIVGHYAWGIHYLRQDRLWDDVSDAIELEDVAMESMTVEDLGIAEKAFTDVIDSLQEGDPAEFKAQISLARARTTLYKGKLVAAMSDLETQLAMAAKNGASQKIQRDIRETLARCLFGIAWVMRHEGASQEHWKKVADKSRQHFRYLTEFAPNEEERTRSASNLEIAIRLERLDSNNPWLQPSEQKK
jgi:hypothetical protein